MPKIEATPGPWKWQKVGPEYVLWRDAGMRDVVLDTSRNGPLRVRIAGIMCAFYPDHPDMKLIAAAPELKEALINALAILDQIASSGVVQPIMGVEKCADAANTLLARLETPDVKE